jgi:VWFA-related protein
LLLIKHKTFKDQKKMRAKILMAITLSLVIGFIPLSTNIFCQTQEKPLHHEVRVVLVDVPVYVIDKNGNPVLDLAPEDFILSEEGKVQKITHCALIVNDSPRIRTVLREHPSAQRHFFLLFDLSFVSLKGILKARDAALRFIQEQLLPTDLVSLGAYSVMSGLKIVVPFTADKEQLVAGLNTLGLVESSNRIKGPAGLLFKPYQDLISLGEKKETGESIQEEVQAMIEDSVRDVNRFNKETYKGYVVNFVDSLKGLAQALNIISGRKHLIFFSDGFDSEVLVGKATGGVDEQEEAFLKREIWKIDTELAGSSLIRTRLLETLQLFINSDCLIHTVDTGGLRSEAQVDTVSGSPTSLAASRGGQDTLNLIARETGGLAFRNVNDLNKPLEDIIKLSNAYYLLGYTPEEKEKEGKFRKIKVEVKRPDLQVSYRKGFYSEKPFEKYSDFEKQLQLVESIASEVTSDEVKFDCLPAAYEATPEIAQLPVFLQFPGQQFLEKKPKPGQVKLEIYGFALNSRREFVDFFQQPLGLDLKKLGKKLGGSGIKYFDLLLVPPGDTYEVKIVVRDSETGEIGSRIHQVRVPDYKEKTLAISTPVFIGAGEEWILARGYDPAKPSGRKKGGGLPVDYPFVTDGQSFIPAVLPVVRPAAPSQVYVRVYNLKLHPEARIPQTQMKFEAVDSAGRATPISQIGLAKKPTQPQPDVHELLFQFAVDDLVPDTYIFRITLTDTLAAATVSAETPFIFQK